MGDLTTFKIKIKEFVTPTLQKIGKGLDVTTKRFKKSNKQMDSSLKKITEKFEKLQTKIDGLDVPNELKKELEEINAEMSKLDKSSAKGVGKSKKRFSALNKFGRLAGARNGMAAFRSGSLLAAAGINPIVAGVGLATVGAVKLGGALVSSSQKLENNLQITKQLLGGTLYQTKELTTQGTALSKVYGTDYKDNIQAAATLSKQFGISSSNAFKLIEKGYASGANISGSMLSTLNESAATFKKFGASANQQVAIIQQSISKGIEDAPKLLESFNENLPNLGGDVKRLLDQNFGKNFTNTLKKNLASGQTTASEALKAISTAISQTPLAQGSAESLAEQIFGDKSDSAVKLLSSFQSFNTNLDSLVTKNDRFNKTKIQQIQLEKQIAATQLKSSKKLTELGNKFKIYGLKIKLAFLNGISGIGGFIDKMIPFGQSVLKLGSNIYQLGKKTGAFKLIFWPLKTLFKGVAATVEGLNYVTDKFLNSIISKTDKVNARVKKFAPLKPRKDEQQRSAALGLFKGVLPTKQETTDPILKSLRAQSNIAKKIKKDKAEADLFKTTADKPDLSPESKNQLKSGLNSIVTGGTQTRNVTTNVNKLVAVESLFSSFKEAKQDIEAQASELLVRIIQGGEAIVNKG